MHSNFQLSGENPTTKAVQSRFGILISWNSRSDIDTFNFNLLNCSPQFIRYKLHKNLNIKCGLFNVAKMLGTLVLRSNTDRSWGNAVVLAGGKSLLQYVVQWRPSQGRGSLLFHLWQWQYRQSECWWWSLCWWKWGWWILWIFDCWSLVHLYSIAAGQGHDSWFSHLKLLSIDR